MERNQILKEILSDPDIIKKYNIDKNEFESLTTNPPYKRKIIEVLSVIINENDNHIGSSRIYKKLKNIHNI